MALIHTTIPANGYIVKEGLMPENSEADFDRASMEVIFRGTEAQLRAAFPRGAQNYTAAGGSVGSGARMICTGVRVTRSVFGFVWARVEWLGLITAPANVLVGGSTLQYQGAAFEVHTVTNKSTTYEIILPISVEGGSPVGALPPYNAANANYERSRVRVINTAAARDFSGIMIIPRNAPPGSPKMLGGTRPAGLSTEFNSAEPGSPALAISRANYFTGINTANKGGGGWLLRDFQAGSAFILGDWLLCKWTASFEWVDRFDVG